MLFLGSAGARRIRPFHHGLDFLRGRMRAYNDALSPVSCLLGDVLWSAS
jgi:hypothetical protein